MPYRERTITVVSFTADARQVGRCRYCNTRILWATTASAKGQPSRTLPFDLPKPWPLRTERNDETGIAFEVWPASSLHFTTCTKRRPAIRPRASA